MAANRIKSGISQTDLGTLLGLSQNAVSKLELKYTKITVEVFLRYCNAINIDAMEILKQVEAISG
ncbi:helix-turn-helix domain-containing protein [Mucilaginibacter ginkgonis]